MKLISIHVPVSIFSAHRHFDNRIFLQILETIIEWSFVFFFIFYFCYGLVIRLTCILTANRQCNYKKNLANRIRLKELLSDCQWDKYTPEINLRRSTLTIGHRTVNNEQTHNNKLRNDPVWSNMKVRCLLKTNQREY